MRRRISTRWLVYFWALSALSLPLLSRIVWPLLPPMWQGVIGDWVAIWCLLLAASLVMGIGRWIDWYVENCDI